MASAAKPTAGATSNTISAGSTPTTKPKSRTLDSSDTSDYENLSSCTSGRYATLPSQSQFGESGISKGNGGSGQYRDHYPTTASSAGVLFRPASGTGSFVGDNGSEQFPSGDPSTAHTLSLHRPIKRSHWLNHNGRQSDVLARVFQANQDWLESNDQQDNGATTSSSGNVTVSTIKDARTSHRTRSAQLQPRPFSSFRSSSVEFYSRNIFYVFSNIFDKYQMNDSCPLQAYHQFFAILCVHYTFFFEVDSFQKINR